MSKKLGDEAFFISRLSENFERYYEQVVIENDPNPFSKALLACNWAFCPLLITYNRDRDKHIYVHSMGIYISMAICSRMV